MLTPEREQEIRTRVDDEEGLSSEQGYVLLEALDAERAKVAGLREALGIIRQLAGKGRYGVAWAAAVDALLGKLEKTP